MSNSVSGLDAKIELSRIFKQAQIGIITGSGPEAGIDLWQKILSGRRKALGRNYRGDIDAPKVKVLSVPSLGLSMDMERHSTAVWPDLLSAATEMANTCGAYSIACNTLHYFAPQLHKLHGDKFVSIQNALRKELKSQNRQNFALLGAEPVMSLGQWSSYAELKDDYEIETGDPKIINQIIYSIKKGGISTQEDNGKFEKVVNGLISRVVVLGCTELPLIPRYQMTNHTFIDATTLISNELLARATNTRIKKIK